MRRRGDGRIGTAVGDRVLDHPNFGWARGRRTWPEASPAAAEARRRCASPRSVGRIARAASLARAPAPTRRASTAVSENLSWPTVRVAPSATPSPRARRAQEIAVDEVPTRRSATTREARAPPWRPRAPPGRAFDAAYASAIGRTFVTRAAIVPGGKKCSSPNRRARWSAACGGALRVVADARKGRSPLARANRPPRSCPRAVESVAQLRKGCDDGRLSSDGDDFYQPFRGINFFIGAADETPRI